MKKSSTFRLLPAAVLLSVCMSAPVTTAWAAETASAVCQPPARSAAIIAVVPGFKSYELDLYIGKRTINEGVVIRKSFIENGKIIIPPEGLYYSSRLGSIGTMTNLELVMLGKRQHVVNEEYEYIILKDHTLKLDETIKLLDDGSRLLQFTNSKAYPYGNIAQTANVRILKASGNYYGADFTVAISPTLKDFSSGKYNDGLGLPEGHYLLPADETGPLYHNTYFGSSTFPSGQSYLIANKGTVQEISIKEFGTPSLTRLWLSAAPRISGAYAVGDKVDVGNCTVEVLAVFPSEVSLRFTEATGKSHVHNFTKLNEPAASAYLPSSAHDRAQFQMNSADGKVNVQIAMLKPGGPVVDGKVNLDMYSDVYEVKNPQPWPTDTRFLARPDT